MKRYGTIVVDPPWPYKTPGQIGKTLEHRPNRDNGLSKHGAGSTARYGQMSLDELAELRIEELTDSAAHLYLWTTNTFMEEAYPLARAWGFRVVTILTWAKTKKQTGFPQPSMKMGYYYRGATEHCLFCVRGSLRLKGAAASTAIFAPRTKHSEKPEEFYRIVEDQSPESRLDIFARKKRDGWDVVGDEVESDLSMLDLLPVQHDIKEDL